MTQALEVWCNGKQRILRLTLFTNVSQMFFIRDERIWPLRSSFTATHLPRLTLF